MKYIKKPNVPFRIERCGKYQTLGINNLYFNEVVKDHLYYVSFDAKDKRLYEDYTTGCHMGPDGKFETLTIMKHDKEKDTFASVEFLFALDTSKNQSWGFSLIETRYGIRGVFIDETWCMEGKDVLFEGLKRYVRVKKIPLKKR